MKRIVAIDPGTEKSGIVVWDGAVVEACELPNQALLRRLKERSFGGAEIVAIEMIACYGMAVGKETFETCVWIGRFMERSGIPTHLIYRTEVKAHLCGTIKAKDTNIRQALIDKHGRIGTAKNRGPLYGVTGHMWSALAVADYTADNIVSAAI